ncbi:RNA guanine-N7 methyltransferase activating subunit-like [Melanotaenia boesemani]|uniref:RNA guanine-N7 methyltransferase activating subunit-like n=1 Tax=Melanotaenia boesemani TaxID=1250792 RepID=UPI001C05736B|nr:RNA guanine-N7 methyltransferase activating subunit-like [Melanotaenia boesemani]XP_041838871.1 RNA guanine-N7 methyltransferase activating subunit-like [Melanotaenia boesemani]
MTEASENLQNYEDLFANRFTSEDHEYQQYLNRPADPPPIVEDWRGRGGGNQRGRDNRYQDRRAHGDRGWGGGRDWGGDRGWRGGHRGQHWHNRDRDRYSGHGSGYQSGPPSSNQGYNSYHQRPRHDRY